MRSRTIALLFGSVLAISACTGSEQTTADQSEVPGSAASSGSSDASNAAESTSTLMVDLLARLPLASYEEAQANEASVFEVELADYAAVSDLIGLDRPDSSDLDASLEWVRSLSLGQPVANGGTGLVVNPARFPDPDSLAMSDEVAAELGFSFFDVDRVAVATALPVLFAAVEGDGLALSSDLADLGDGVMSAGEGEDFEINVDVHTAARPLGRPLRLGLVDGVVGASVSTPVIESWLAGGASMLDVPAFAEAAAALDSAGSVTGYFVESDFAAFGVPSTEGTPALSARFNVVGIGMTIVDGQAINAIAFVFDDEASAAATVSELDNAWRNSPLDSFDGMTIADFVEVQSVEQRGRSVLVTASVNDESMTSRVIELLLRGESIFTNR